jgi:hypothetical protein
MSDNHSRRIDRYYGRVEQRLPGRLGRIFRWLMSPAARWLRIPSGLLLIAGGVLGFLPILGFWMIPLGLILLAQDIPFLRRPTGRALVWLDRRLTRWKRRSGSGS